MKVGIIGAGNFGKVVAAVLVKAGHSVSIANSRGPETLKDIAASTGATAATLQEAVKGAELIIVTVPEKAVPDLPADLFKHVPDSVTVVETGNYYPEFRDPPVEELVSLRLTESEWVARQLGRPGVVKALNNIMAESMEGGGLPRGDPNRIALPVAGDDAQAKQVVMRVIDELGFDAIDAGSLSESWRQQPGTPAYCTDLTADRLRAALARADRARTPQTRAESVKRLFSLRQGTPPAAMVTMARELMDSSYPEAGTPAV